MNYQKQINGCRNLTELKETLNAIEAELDGVKLEEVIDLSDLPTFGTEPENTSGIYSYDETHRLVPADFGWKIEERDDEITAAAKTLGRKGGQAKSERKTAAVRENGRLGGRPKAEEMTYELINDDGCLMSSTRTTSFKKAREYFNDQYEGKYIILCGEIDDRRNVILK